MELLQRLDQEEIDGKPDRPAPVRVAAEQARRRLARLVGRPDARCRSPRARRADPGARATAPESHTARGTRARRASRPGRAAVAWDRARSRGAARLVLASSMLATPALRSGRCSMNQSSRRLNAGRSLQPLGLQRLDGEQRNQSDHRSHLAGALAARRACAARRRRTRLPRSRAPRPSWPPRWLIALAMFRKCSQNLLAMSS